MKLRNKLSDYIAGIDPIDSSRDAVVIRARQQGQLILSKIRKLLMDLYLTGKITNNEYNKIERLILSKDAENQILGFKILNKKCENRISIQYNQQGDFQSIKLMDN
jgi:hypothetical protein